MADELENRLRTLLRDDPDARTTAHARTAVAGTRTTDQRANSRRAWRMALAIGAPVVAALFATLIIMRPSDPASPPHSRNAMTPGERVAASLGWGLSSGVTHISMRAFDTGTVARSDMWWLNAPTSETQSASRSRTATPNAGPVDGDFMETAVVTRPDGTASSQVATADLGGTIRIWPQTGSAGQFELPGPPFARELADGTLTPGADNVREHTMRFTGGVDALRDSLGDVKAEVIGPGPAVTIDVDTTRWIPLRITTAALRVTIEEGQVDTWPKVVMIVDAVEQLPSDPATVDKTFDLRRVHPNAAVSEDTSSGGGSSDPAQVVQMYVEAINGGDIEFARSLCTPQFAQRVDGQRDSWFHQTVHVTVTKIGAKRTLTPTAAGLPDGSAAVEIPVKLDVRQERPLSIPNGAVTWGYHLVRQPDGSWLIFDEGV